MRFYSKTFFLKPCGCLSIFGLKWSALKTTLHENTDQNPVLAARRGQKKGPHDQKKAVLFSVERAQQREARAPQGSLAKLQSWGGASKRWK